MGLFLDDLVIAHRGSRGWYLIPVSTEMWIRGFIRILEEGKVERAKFLQIIRDQLQIMTDLMADTPHPRAYQDAFYWMGDMPAAPQLYTPERWQEKNHSIHSIWGEYLSEIEKAGLQEHLTKANALQVADLLAASLNVEKGEE